MEFANEKEQALFVEGAMHMVQELILRGFAPLDLLDHFDMVVDKEVKINTYAVPPHQFNITTLKDALMRHAKKEDKNFDETKTYKVRLVSVELNGLLQLKPELWAD
ncbi:hypothetical protein [Entomospira culicis]|uniref:Uncharacterized protein n=1 Tax=Entomospira culicis TaxID=2719989 RepID=A0A968KX77_9SPIO|nr:hypothetical protein [Entomospira culicis]NIZ19843.1 hypothetical protein [Entomospira culicis]NIZ70057.1 hypothetical protein [Entomospira culicis]WDI37161.1 hypothetical protein PVA46_07530 [Entomospira culicis]WDI38790.1 hypothetical protein PVA47_07540 [Entomospira culicis]